MTNQFPLWLGLSVSTMAFYGCGTEPSQPRTDNAAQTVDTDGQVTFLVQGMMERLSIY